MNPEQIPDILRQIADFIEQQMGGAQGGPQGEAPQGGAPQGALEEAAQ